MMVMRNKLTALAIATLLQPLVENVQFVAVGSHTIVLRSINEFVDKI